MLLRFLSILALLSSLATVRAESEPACSPEESEDAVAVEPPAAKPAEPAKPAVAAKPVKLTRTYVLHGPLTEKSAFHLQESFIQNSGAKLDAYPYQNYNVVLAYLKGVEEMDVPVLEKAVSAWIAANRDLLYSLKFGISHAESDAKKVLVVGEYMNNDYYRVRDSMNAMLRKLCPPSGKTYELDLNHKGIFVPSIIVGEIKGPSPRKVRRLINRRIDDANRIYHKDYFEVQVERVALVSR